MVERLCVKLSLTQEEAMRYTPAKGIDVSFIKWEKPDVVVCEFVTSELHPNPLYRKTAQDLRHEVGTVFRNRILQDNLTNYPLRSRRMMTLYAVLEHPNVRGRGVPRDIKRAAEAATEVTDIEMTAEQVEYMAKISGIRKDEIEAKEVRQKRMRSTRSLGPGGGIETTEEGPLQEVHVFQSGLIDAG